MTHLRALIVTQKVDREDPILGFFHRWIQEFARHGRVTVIGQMVGEHDLPSVTVLSLGKEKGRGRAAQILNFYRLLWSHRSSYDVVFVHMTPVWAVLGWPLFFILRKRIYLWYEARGGGLWLRIAGLIVRRIFSASKAGMPFATRKQMVVGHGIDTDVFHPADARREKNLLVTVGRITASKRLDVIMDAAKSIPSTRLEIIGVPQTLEDRTLEAHLRNIACIRSLSPAEIPALLQCATVFLHASETSLDKALLEAMACACPVVSCASAVQDLLPEACRSTLDTFSDRVKAMLVRSPEERARIGAELRTLVERDHALPTLIARIAKVMLA